MCLQIRLSDNGLTGQIPASIGAINTLKDLVLSHNALTGKIPPGTSPCPPLCVVFTGPLTLLQRGVAVFGDMPALVLLDLSWNQLSGSIPANMVNFTYVSMKWGG